MKCRHCATQLERTWVDLGSAPPSNAYTTENGLHAPETWFPLRVLVCESCWLAQTEDFAGREELFDADYAYFSSFSNTWLAHAERYVQNIVDRFDLRSDSHVVEIAANDGYLLQYVKARGIPCLGIEPTRSTASAAREKGLQIIEDFFGVNLAKEMAIRGQRADLMVANNVLAHVPDINDFLGGFVALLKPNGVATFEFPHLLSLMEQNQFDTIYHEHFSYLSLTAVNHMFSAIGLNVFDVEELVTHGGSLRVFAQRLDSGRYDRKQQVDVVLQREVAAGLNTADAYVGFQKRVNQAKDDFLSFLLQAKRQGKHVAGYGAAAKGNTLMNYAGVRHDLIPYVVDRNPTKQGKYMPGSRIPIVNESWLREIRPDYVVIFPWNIQAEVMEQIDYIRAWGARFVVAIPQLSVLP